MRNEENDDFNDDVGVIMMRIRIMTILDNLSMMLIIVARFKNVALAKGKFLYIIKLYLSFISAISTKSFEFPLKQSWHCLAYLY